MEERMNRTPDEYLILRMDKAIRMLNDEENGVFETWIEEYVPDGATSDDIVEILENDPLFFDDCCRFFARHMAEIIVHGEYNKDGWCVEFFNPDAIRKE